MSKIIVEVMPKDEILDPQGKAIVGALGKLGIKGVKDVRQGKRFELTFEGDNVEEDIRNATIAAEKVLSNSIIEKVVNIEKIN